MVNIVIISGYFDPLHSGHLEYIKQAKEYGNELWVIVNNDLQVILKKEKSFMNEIERIKILMSLKNVDRVILSRDEDRSVNRTLLILRGLFPLQEFIFANGGDVNRRNCREEKQCKLLGIKTIYGLGKKIQSSSWLTRIKEK